MILIGTDEGIYRWFDGCGWPIFHSLQDRTVVGLASPGGGVIVALDRTGDVLESVDNGMSWRVVDLPAGAGRPSAVAVERQTSAVVLAAKPLAVYKRKVGTVPPKAPVKSSRALVRHARSLADDATALILSRPPRPAVDAKTLALAGWTPLLAPPAPKATIAPEVRVLAVGDGVPSWFAAVSGAGLWKSGDQGKTWTPVQGSSFRDFRGPIDPRAGTPLGGHQGRLLAQRRRRYDLGRPQRRPGKRPPRPGARRPSGQARRPARGCRAPGPGRIERRIEAGVKLRPLREHERRQVVVPGHAELPRQPGVRHDHRHPPRPRGPR